MNGDVNFRTFLFAYLIVKWIMGLSLKIHQLLNNLLNSHEF